MPKDYYKILAVEKNASSDEIKKAFRKLAHQYHPDKQGGDAVKFKEALEAYTVLSNAEKRRQYDQFGATFDQAGAGGFGQDFGGVDFSQFSTDFPDLSDILGGIFGFSGGGEGRGGGRARARGHDIEKDIQLTFQEAVFGVTKQIELYAHLTCRHCSGGGAEPGAKLVSCDRCGGQGRVQQVQRTVFGAFQTVATCEACGGEGQRPAQVCKRCSGTGVVRDTKKLEVKVPAGVEDGGVIRLPGEGEAAPRGGVFGNLYIRIRVKDDSNFERHGQDIFSRLAIPFTTVALGGKIKVETVDGPVELKIPAGTQSNALFRLRGKGVPQMRGSGRGDHLVEVIIAVPKKLSRQQKKLLEDFDKE